MKKMKLTITGVLVLLGMFIQSCTKDFTDINTNPNETPIATASSLMAPALVNTLTANMLRNRNFNNELMQVTVDISDADGKVFRYDFRATWADYSYNAWYTELTNFKDMEKVARDPKNLNRSYVGIALICQSWIYSLLTDTYGDVPYFKSNLARDSGIFEPPFDAQKDIYMDIFKKLDTANTYLKTGTGINSNNDPVFNGDVTKWRRFGNSLYLRLLMRISGKAEVSDEVIAKFKEIAVTKKADYPLMTTPEESAVLRWTGTGPFVSPFMSVREQDFRAPGIGAFFIGNLVTWNDPRIDVPTWGNNSVNRWRIAAYQGGYIGVPSGYVSGQAPVKQSYFYSQTNTTLFNLQTDAMTGIMMNSGEVNFILAEAVVKGWITGDAALYYKNGIEQSIQLWLPKWVDQVDDYIDKADIHWDEAAPLEDKMERLHLQKYYCLFMTDMQQWIEYRRTGHPVIPKGAGLRNNGVMPARMTYPVYVQSTNPTNYKIAVARQGADVISTEVWWQKP